MNYMPLVKNLFKLRETLASRAHTLRADELPPRHRLGPSGWLMELLVGAGFLRLKPVRKHQSVNETRL